MSIQLFLAAEALRLSEALRAAGVTPVILKGPALAVQCGLDPAGREFGDIDIMVGRKELPAAGETLASLGYRLQERLEHCLDAAPRLPLARLPDAFTFTNRQGVRVEVHLNPVAWPLTAPFAPDLWTKNLAPVAMGGGTLTTLGDEETAVLLVVHGTSHYWESASLVRDLAVFLEAHPRLDRQAIARLFEDAGCLKMWVLALRLVAGDASAVGEVRGAGQGSEEPLSPWAQMNYFIRLWDSPWARWRFVLRHLFTPRVNTFQAVRLPVALFALYYPLHLVRGFLGVCSSPSMGRM